MYDFKNLEKKEALNSIHTRAHAYVRCLIGKSIDEGHQYSAHNGIKLRPVTSPEIIIPQILPHILRLTQIEISILKGSLFEAINFNVDTSNSVNTVVKVTIDDLKVNDQLLFFSVIKYVFEFIFLKNNYNSDITLFSKANRYL